VRTNTCPVFGPQALGLRSPAPSKTVVINARHGPWIEADQRVIVMADDRRTWSPRHTRAFSWWSRASPSNRTWRGRCSPGQCARFGATESATRPAGWRRSVEQVRTNTSPVFSISTAQLPESTKILAVDLRTQTCPLLAPPHEHPRSLGAALAGAARSVFFYAEVSTERLNRISRLFYSGELTPRVGTLLPLNDVRTAHEMLAGAPHKRGKIVLEVNG
jgi:hypothetical protein